MHSTLIDNQHLMEAIGETLETMAFISLLPAEPPFAQPAEPMLVRIQFTGNIKGALELVAPLELGKAIVTGVIGDPRQMPTEAQACDALKELMNVAAGSLLRSADHEDNFDISLPTTPIRLTDIEWMGYVESGRAAVVEAEGSIIALCVMISD